MVRFSNFVLAISFLLFVPAAFAGEFQIKVIDPHSAAVAGAQVFVYRAEDSAPAQVRSTSGEGIAVFNVESAKALRAELADTLEDASNELSGTARMALQEAFEHWRVLDDRLRWCDRQVGEHVRSSAAAQRAASITGIGALTASASTASVGDFGQFRNGGQFGAWLGLVPRQNSSGGKTVLGRITRRGDDYLRTLFIQGAKSALMSAHKRSDPISRWVLELKERVGWQKACVALANKNARILWAVMTREAGFDAAHVSVKPAAKAKPAQGSAPDVPALCA